MDPRDARIIANVINVIDLSILLLDKLILNRIGINCPNPIIQSVMSTAIYTHESVFGENYRYFSYKYKIVPLYWFKPLSKVLNCVKLFVHNHVINPRDGYFIRELCIIRDSNEDSILTSSEMSQLV